MGKNLKGKIGGKDFTDNLETPKPKDKPKGPAQTPPKNPFHQELIKFAGKECIVADINGKEYKGICKAISPNHLNVILMTDTEKIIVKNISSIIRKRGV